MICKRHLNLFSLLALCVMLSVTMLNAQATFVGNTTNIPTGATR